MSDGVTHDAKPGPDPRIVVAAVVIITGLAVVFAYRYGSAKAAKAGVDMLEAFKKSLPIPKP